MSLQVWLPLNGNLNNQGLSGDATISGTASYSSGGKIANNYLSSNNSININVPTIKGNKICTFSFWAYVVSSSITSNWTLIARIDDQGTNAGSNMRFEICPKTNYDGIYCFSNHNNTNYGLTDGCIVSPPGGYYDQWVHFCFTSDGSTFTRYMNGVKIGTCAYNGQATFSGNFQLTNNDKCYKQDVRIYDHCLSAKEVSEIAKGLILHYPLNNGGFGAPNLAKNTNVNDTSYFGLGEQTGGSTKEIVYDNGVPCVKITRNTTEHSGWHFYYHNSIDLSAIKTSTTYTVSLDIKASVSGTLDFLGLVQGNATNWMTGSKTIIQNSFTANEWSHLVYRTTTIDSFDNISVSDQVIYFVGNSLLGTNTSIMVKNVKLEEGSIDTVWTPHYADVLYQTLGLNSTTEYDCSGLGNNGIKQGTILCNSSSARYDTSYRFTGSNYLSVKNIAFENMDNGTLSFWIKFNNFNNWTHYIYFANGFNWTGNGLDFIIVANNSSLSSSVTSTNINIDCCSYNNPFTASLNTWYHIVITWDKNTYIIKKYINGEFYAINDDNANKRLDSYKASHGNHFIGNGSMNNSHAGDFNISDFRIYSTTLSDKDIRELYNIPLSIDNKGNSYAYNYLEKNNPNISKTGVLENIEIVEDNSFQIAKNRLTANQIIEY